MLRIKLKSAIMELGYTYAPAIAQAKSQFKNDGSANQYTVVTENGKIRYQGIVLETGQRFDLRVGKSGRVQGKFDGRNLTYGLSKKARDHIAARLAAANSLASGLDLSSR
jgi:hypothetical protein